jgi:hypothetical protein
MNGDLVQRPWLRQAVQHETTGSYFVSIQMDEGHIWMTPARAVRGLIPVVIIPAAAESSVPQVPPITWPNLCEPESALQDDFAEGQTG